MAKNMNNTPTAADATAAPTADPTPTTTATAAPVPLPAPTTTASTGTAPTTLPTLTPHDVRVLILSWKSFTPAPKINAVKMAELGGYKTAASANTAFAVLRRKLIGDYQQWAGRATRGKGKPVLVVEDSEDDDEEAEAGEDGEGGEDAVAVPAKKAPLKRKAGTTTEGADDGDAEGEDSEVDEPIKKKLKSMKVGGAVEGEKEKEKEVEDDKVVEKDDEVVVEAAKEDEEAEDADNENEE